MIINISKDKPIPKYYCLKKLWTNTKIIIEFIWQRLLKSWRNLACPIKCTIKCIFQTVLFNFGSTFFKVRWSTCEISPFRLELRELKWHTCYNGFIEFCPSFITHRYFILGYKYCNLTKNIAWKFEWFYII